MSREEEFWSFLQARPACPDCGQPQWAYCCSIARNHVAQSLVDDPRWSTVQSVLSRALTAVGELSAAEWQLVFYYARGDAAARTRRTVVEVRDRFAALVRDLDGLLAEWPAADVQLNKEGV